MTSKLDHIKSPRVQPLAYQSEKGKKEGILYKDIPVYNVIFAGHVDAGKSTLTGQILLASGLVSQHTIEQFRKEAASIGKQSFNKAWVTDIHQAQREKGVTIDIAHVQLFTGKRYYTIIDSPGHMDFIRNMITGAGQADLLALIIDAGSLYDNLKGWVSRGSIDKNPIQSLNSVEQATNCRGFGVDKAIIVLNKFDEIPQAQRNQAFLFLRKHLQDVLSREVGYKPQSLSWAPVSAWQSKGILQAYPGIPASTSKGIVKDLDEIDLGPVSADLPLRINVETVLKEISGTNVVVTGKVQSGIVKPGDTVILKPCGLKATVRSVQMHRKELKFAGPCYNVGIDLKGITGNITELKKKIGKNTVISHQKDAPKIVQEFVAKVILKKVPSVKEGLQAERSKIIIHTKGGLMSCLIKKIMNPVNLVTRKPIAEGQVPVVMGNTLCQITFVPDQPIVVESKSVHPKNSHITLREGSETLGWGNVTSVTPSKYEIS